MCYILAWSLQPWLPGHNWTAIGLWCLDWHSWWVWSWLSTAWCCCQWKTGHSWTPGLQGSFFRCQVINSLWDSYTASLVALASVLFKCSLCFANFCQLRNPASQPLAFYLFTPWFSYPWSNDQSALNPYLQPQPLTTPLPSPHRQLYNIIIYFISLGVTGRNEMKDIELKQSHERLAFCSLELLLVFVKLLGTNKGSFQKIMQQLKKC